MDQDHNAARAAATKSRKRPHSRASTNSANSAGTQSNLDQSAFTDANDLYQGQWMAQEHGHPKDIQSGHQISPEDMILQAATHMQAQGQDFAAMQGNMGPPMGHHMAYQQHAQHHPQQHAQHYNHNQHPSSHHHQQQHQHPSMSRHPLPVNQHVQANGSFMESDSQMMDRDDDADSMNGVGGPLKSAGSRSSANNELEMRQLFGSNRHRTLHDVAHELHGNERGPNSERTRQVFAMLWINSVCSKGKGSVPRGRVYANYASRCATERITVLNPASFGKLVRVLFPGLKTRRLGVRGESKYHYVNFELVEDHPEARQSQSQEPPRVQEITDTPQDFNSAPTQPRSDSSFRPALPSPNPPASKQHTPSPAIDSDSKPHSLYNQPDIVGSIDNLQSTSAKTVLQLAFAPKSEDSFDQSEALGLPPIEAFLPSGTDPDAAKSLSALYRSHCTSLVESMRFVREKSFFHLYTSFQGTLTMPVQKLFGNPHIAPWIEECDFVLYQRMMRILSGLTLQVVPKPVLDTLRSISERLVPHIRESFQGQPQHVIEAKEAPATIFAALLDRTLRVNLTAHAAANMLSNPANRDQMYVDWISSIRARKIAECVPTRAMDDVVSLMVNEIRDLLDPANVPWELECTTIYGAVISRNARGSTSGGGGGDGTSTGANVLDRWVSFLRSLPDRFPYASHADIVWCVERVGTALMRDLTLSQGKSFGSWWVTKTWVDEMVCFLAEQGGFQKQKNARARGSITTTAAPKSQVTSKQPSRQASRYSSGSDDVPVTNVAHTQPGRAPFPPPSNHHQNGHNGNNNNNQATMGVNAPDVNDDSGIGIRTPEDEFSMEKFTYARTDGAGSLSHGDLAVETGA